MKLRKLVVALLLLTTVMMLVGGCSCSTSENSSNGTSNSGNTKPDVVNIGVQKLVTPELIARYEKVFEDYLGYKVNLIQFDSGADVNRAFASKSIDIGMMGSAPAAIGIATDMGYEVIWLYDVIGTAESLVVQNDSGINSVNDLEGKKVATPFASTAHFSLQNALNMSNIDSTKVELYDMQPDDIYAAWVRKDIDAAYVWDPVLSKLKSEQGRVILSSANLAAKGITTADVCVVNKEFAKEYPDIVTGYLKALMYSVDLFNNDREKAISEISQALDISIDDARMQVEGFRYPDGEEQLSYTFFGKEENRSGIAGVLKQTGDFLKEQGSINNMPEIDFVENCCTGEFIERALNEKNT